MKLSIVERIQIPQLLPGEGNRLTMKAIQGIKDKVGFSAEELEKYKLVTLGEGKVQWNKKAEDSPDIDLSDAELRILCENYMKLDEENKITSDLFFLGERIYELVHGEEK